MLGRGGGLTKAGNGHSQPVGAAQFGAWEEKGSLGWAPPASAGKSFHFAGNPAINTKKCSPSHGWE